MIPEQAVYRLLKEALTNLVKDTEVELLKGNFTDLTSYKYKVGMRDGLVKSLYAMEKTMEEIFNIESEDEYDGRQV